MTPMLICCPDLGQKKELEKQTLALEKAWIRLYMERFVFDLIALAEEERRGGQIASCSYSRGIGLAQYRSGSH